MPSKDNISREQFIEKLNDCHYNLKKKYGIISLRLFGSMARNEQKSDSDIDLFVETETPNPFLLMDAKEYIENSIGRPVDIIRNHRNLNPRLRKRIERDGITIFWKKSLLFPACEQKQKNNKKKSQYLTTLCNFALVIDNFM